MPKASQRKKAERTKDFQKVKLKLGKKLTTDASHTATAFKSRSINIPKQLIQKSDGDTLDSCKTVRQLNVKDLTAQLNHPGYVVRKDALLGLKELIVNFELLKQLQPDAFQKLLLPVLRLLLDVESVVRKALLTYITTFIEQLNDTSPLQPHMDKVVVYCSSALTHHEELIRLDGIKFLAIWLNKFPKVFLSYQERLLPTVFSMLGTGDKLEVQPSSRLSKTANMVQLLSLILKLMPLDQVQQTIEDPQSYVFQGKTVFLESTVMKVKSQKVNRMIVALNSNVDKFNYLVKFQGILVQLWIQLSKGSFYDSFAQVDSDSWKQLVLCMQLIDRLWTNSKNDNFDGITPKFARQSHTLLQKHIFKFFPQEDQSLWQLNSLVSNVSDILTLVAL